MLGNIEIVISNVLIINGNFFHKTLFSHFQIMTFKLYLRFQKFLPSNILLIDIYHQKRLNKSGKHLFFKLPLIFTQLF